MGEKKRTGKKPWVGIVALVLALAMIVSLFFTGLMGLGGIPGADEQNGEQITTVDELYREAENLENHIEEYGPNPTILRRLASVYFELDFYAAMEDPDVPEDEEEEDYMQKAGRAAEEALEMDPDNPENYVLIYEIYRGMGKEDQAAEKAEEAEELLRELLEEDPADNLNRFYYSIILELHREDIEAAKEQMEKILETEPEGSPLYEEAAHRQQQLRSHLEQDVDEPELDLDEGLDQDIEMEME